VSKITYFHYDQNTVEDKKEKVRIKFKTNDFLDDEYVDEILNKAKNMRVMIVLNSVRRAQLMYQRLIETESKTKVGLLHSRMVFFKRKFVEESWLGMYGKDNKKREIGCILVGSQILEQSLDIDCDCLYTDLCPIDILIQRLGRLWRFPNIKRKEGLLPEVNVFVPGKISKLSWSDTKKNWRGIIPLVYSDYILLKTYYVLKRRKLLDTEKEIRKFLSKVYSETSNDPKWFKEHYDKKEASNKKEYDAAINEMINAINERNLSDDDIEILSSIENLEEVLERNRPPATRFIKQASGKFVLLKNIDMTEEGDFVLYFYNGERVEIPHNLCDKDVSGEEKRKAAKQRIDIWKTSLENSVPIAYDRFDSGFEIKKELKEFYKDTVLEQLFGLFLFLLIVDRNGRLLDMNGNCSGCEFIYTEEIGLYKEVLL